MENQAFGHGRGVQERAAENVTPSNPNPVASLIPSAAPRVSRRDSRGGSLGDRFGTAPSHPGEPTPSAPGFRQQQKPPDSSLRAFTSALRAGQRDRKSTRLNSSHVKISYAVFCLKKKSQK